MTRIPALEIAPPFSAELYSNSQSATHVLFPSSLRLPPCDADAPRTNRRPWTKTSFAVMVRCRAACMQSQVAASPRNATP
eukprot:3935488-Rhodomonas_salina.2